MNGLGNACETVAGEDNAGGFDSHIGSAADGHAHICRGQGRSIVDAVSHHANLMTFFLNVFYGAGFFIGTHFREHIMDPALGSDYLGCLLVVTGEHTYVDMHVLQCFDGCLGFRFDGIGHGNEPTYFFIRHNHHNGFSLGL